MSEYIKNENKQHLVDPWSKRNAKEIWSQEKDSKETLSILTSQSDNKVEEIVDSIEEKRSKKFFEVDWKSIKKYVKKHVEEDVGK